MFVLFISLTAVLLYMVLNVMYVYLYGREAEHALLESVRHWRPQYLEWMDKMAAKAAVVNAMRYDVAGRKLQRFFRVILMTRRYGDSYS